MRFGKFAPKYGEKILVYPDTDCIYYGKKNNQYGRIHSGKVMNISSITKDAYNFQNNRKFIFMHKHFVEGLSWEESGAYQWMVNVVDKGRTVDGIKSFQEITERYNDLDETFKTVKINHKLNSTFSPVLHIGPDSILYFGHGGGAHRLAIAIILNIPFQATVGAIDSNALDYFKMLRERLTRPPIISQSE